MFPKVISKQSPSLVNHLETRILANTLWERWPRTEQVERRLGSGCRGSWTRWTLIPNRDGPHADPGWNASEHLSPDPNPVPPPGAWC